MTIKVYRKDLVPKVAHILKSLYDLDILEEKVIIEWGEKAYKKTVGKEVAEEIHAKAAPFLKWLKEAEEEDSDSDEDDDEDEVDVDFDDRIITAKIQAVDSTPKKTVEKKEEATDIDIDAI